MILLLPSMMPMPMPMPPRTVAWQRGAGRMKCGGDIHKRHWEALRWFVDWLQGFLRDQHHLIPASPYHNRVNPFSEAKVKTHCLLWFRLFAHYTRANNMWSLVPLLFFLLFSIECTFRFVVWLCIVRIYIHSQHVRAVMHLSNVANVYLLLFLYQWL
jgi:hypothetical protein